MHTLVFVCLFFSSYCIIFVYIFFQYVIFMCICFPMVSWPWFYIHFPFLSSCYDRVGSVYIILICSIFLFLIYILSFLMMSFHLLCSFSLFVWSDWLDLLDCIIMAEPAQSFAAKCRRQVHHIWGSLFHSFFSFFSFSFIYSITDNKYKQL